MIKLTILQKKINSGHVHNKKYLKVEKKKKKKIKTKEEFQCISVPVILIDSVYRKNKNCFSQVWIEEYNFKKTCLILMTEISFDDFYN